MEASRFPYTGQPTNLAASKLQPAAAGFGGNEKQLAVCLGHPGSSLGELMADLQHAPAPMILPAVDIMHAHRATLMPLAAIRKCGVGAASATSQ
jgi:hypothetical protein